MNHYRSTAKHQRACVSKGVTGYWESVTRDLTREFGKENDNIKIAYESVVV